jgi:ABC-type multidrug transport system ATPase subunit
MRILSCYLAATSGTVRVAGLDVFRQSDEVRRRIGYMPENNPLHYDMRVREYLKFGAAEGLGRAFARPVDVVMQQCRLVEVERKLIRLFRGSASGSAWPRRWSTIPRCSSWTSPPSGSIPPRSARSGS